MINKGSINPELRQLKDGLRLSERMPILFLGHGSPMNALGDNQYSRTWTELGTVLPPPQAILVVSAHWMTRGTTLVDISAMPRTIHDFYGFPQELYEQQYPAKGKPALASDVAHMLADHHVKEDDTWGLDHGAWSVLKWLYPDADMPVFQLSIDMDAELDTHLEIGQSLAKLRDRGVLILGSGNVVHNLSTMRSDGPNYDWAEEFDTRFADLLSKRDFKALANRQEWGNLLMQAHPSLDHYIPSLTIAGASNLKDQLLFTNANMDMASVSMRSFVFY